MQLQDSLEQIEGVEQLLMNGLHRALRDLALLLGARAHALVGRERRRDQAKLAGLFPHR